MHAIVIVCSDGMWLEGAGSNLPPCWSQGVELRLSGMVASILTCKPSHEPDSVF